jgi:uncharacterized protein
MSRRVVLDTNCVISALIFSQEKMAWLLQGWQSGSFTPLVNKQTVNELLRVLTYPKFKLTKAEQGLLLADFLPYAETVAPQDAPADLPAARDCADQMFISLAVVGKAEVLVTGDNDLLVLKDTLAIPIMTLSEYSTG